MNRRTPAIFYTRGTVTQNDNGEEVFDWVEFHRAFVEKVPVQGREWEAVQNTWAEASYILKMLFKPGITAGMEVVVGTGSEMERANILDVTDPYSDRHELRLVCQVYKQ